MALAVSAIICLVIRRHQICVARRSLYANQLAGDLPLNWGQGGSFAELRSLYLDTNFLTGSLPPAWGIDAQSWPQLRFL